MLSMRFTSIFRPLIGSLALAVCMAPGLRAADPIPADDLGIFRRYLAKHGMADRWEGEPTPLSSAEIRRAYAGQRFYFTFRRPPSAPGAPLPQILARHQQEMAAYRRHSLRITVGIDQQQNARAFRSPPDFNAGLMPVASDADAATAAAAIASLLNDQDSSPVVVAASQIRVTRLASGWSCRLDDAQKAVVEFDLGGKCLRAEKRPARAWIQPP